MSNETVQKPKKSIMSILKLVATILISLLLVITVVTNLALVYIVFAPDNLPKPFYLVYYVPGQELQLPLVSVNTEPQTSSGQTQTSSHNPTTSSGDAISYKYLWDGIQPGQGIILDTGTKIVNLAEPGGRKFIRTNVVLEFAPNDPVYFDNTTSQSSSGGHGSETTTVTPKAAYEAQFLANLETRMPVINDSIITLLSTKEFEDVYTAEGKDVLRNEIINTVNSRLPEYHVIYVYFTEFVMQ